MSESVSQNPSAQDPSVGGITVTVDGQQQQVATGTTAADLYQGQREVVVARIDFSGSRVDSSR